eukprot:GGOE01018887.1.p1 GENE.GGOE01018887.1~~GGOE01018887.1.p1  ORF type:complete len:490 (+),score=66.83 GGOE01018887.1:30-1499(+)
MSPYTLLLTGVVLLLSLFGWTQYSNVLQSFPQTLLPSDAKLQVSEGRWPSTTPIKPADAPGAPSPVFSNPIPASNLSSTTKSRSLLPTPMAVGNTFQLLSSEVEDIEPDSPLYSQVQSKLHSSVPYIRHLDGAPLFPQDKESEYFMMTDMSPEPKDVVSYTWVTYVEVTYRFTFAIDRQALHDALLPVTEKDPSGLAIVTFANLRYADVFMNWLVALHRLNIRNYCIFAIDEETKSWLQRRKIPTFGVYIKQFAALWYARHIVLRNLAEVGIPFIHSDTDAVWTRNPLPRFFAQTTAHMKFSQGTLAPAPLHSKWGFVTCGGLYFVRPTSFARAWLQVVLEHLLTNPEVPRRATDQDSMNIGLAEFGVEWHVRQNSTYHKKLFGSSFTCSRHEIDGYFKGGNVSVQVLPHHLFMRVSMTTAEKPFVVHLYTSGGPKQTANKLLMLQKQGLQFLIPDWRNITIGQDRDKWLSSLVVHTPSRSRFWDASLI